METERTSNLPRALPYIIVSFWIAATGPLFAFGGFDGLARGLVEFPNNPADVAVDLIGAWVISLVGLVLVLIGTEILGKRWITWRATAAALAPAWAVVTWASLY